MGEGKALGTDATISTGGLGQSGTTSQQLAPGTMVGEYQIERQIGEGGMGRVFAAIHPVIAKRAAIKVLHPEFSVNREMVERFVQEARSVNQIGHPNIVDIFAFGALPDGRCYFVMEHLAGESLRDRISKRRLALHEVLAILDTVTGALEAAHEQGIVHRDLKPDNIFLVEHRNALPEVKLLDFGIAKLLGDDGRVQRTQTGNLMGTPGYISPEQARGHSVDHRTDIYALGAVAYELLTGWLPFPADNAADMIAKHLFAPVPVVRDRNGDVPVELDATVTAMMAKAPAHRPTLSAVRALIAQYRGGGMLPTMVPAGLPGHGPAGLITPPPAGPITAPPYGVMPAGMVSSVEPARGRARTWLFVVLAALLAAGVAVAIVATQGDPAGTAAAPASEDVAQPAPTPTEIAQPAVAQPAAAVTPDAALPAVPPAEVAKPAVEVATPAPEPVVKPPVTTKSPKRRPPAGTRPAGTKPVVTKPAVTKPAVTKPAVTDDDDDAPM